MSQSFWPEGSDECQTHSQGFGGTEGGCEGLEGWGEGGGDSKRQ